MGIKKLFVGQIWNVLWVTARLKRVGRLWVKALAKSIKQHRIWVGKCPLHLVVNNARNSNFAFRVNLFMPPFLKEDLFRFIDPRIKNRIKIHAHKVHQILLIRACNRVNCFVRERHRVQKSLHAALEQVNERLFYWVFFRPAQNGMLQNVKHTSRVRWRRFKRNGKTLVYVLVFKPKDSRPTQFVT